VSGSRLLSPKRAARYLGISLSLFNRWRCDDKEPRVPQPVETRGVRSFCVEDLDAFVNQLKSLRAVAPSTSPARGRRSQVSA
jgi:hypothetical protein